MSPKPAPPTVHVVVADWAGVLGRVAGHTVRLRRRRNTIRWVCQECGTSTRSPECWHAAALAHHLNSSKENMMISKTNPRPDTDGTDPHTPRQLALAADAMIRTAVRGIWPWKVANLDDANVLVRLLAEAAAGTRRPSTVGDLLAAGGATATIHALPERVES